MSNNFPQKVVEIRQTSEACPAQWEGKTENGQSLYIRFRWGVLRAELDGETVFQGPHGGPLDGLIELGAVARLTRGVLDFTGVV